MCYTGNLRVACGWLVVGQAVVRMETGTTCRAGRRKTVPPDDHTRFVAGIVQVNMGSEKILGVSNALARQNAERARQQPASPIPAFAKLFWLLAYALGPGCGSTGLRLPWWSRVPVVEAVRLPQARSHGHGPEIHVVKQWRPMLRVPAWSMLPSASHVLQLFSALASLFRE